MSYWTKDKIELLKKLWASGFSASAIAGKLGDGATRNSVIGKSHRLKLEARGKTKKNLPKSELQINNKLTNKESRLGKKARFRALLLDKNFEPENPVYDLEDLTDKKCRYPIGHPKNDPTFHFCGRTPFNDSVYCKLHLMLCFQPKNAKEEDQITEEDIPKFIEKKIKSA